QCGDSPLTTPHLPAARLQTAVGKRRGSELHMKIQAPRAVVCGAGGFIGGHLVRGLLKRGVEVIRAVDIRPPDDWHQVADEVENVSLDLKDRQNCLAAVSGADHVYQLAADMGGMGFIQANKAL